MAENSQKFVLPSGAELAVTVGTFAEASALLKAILRSLKGMNLTAEALNVEISSLKDNPALISEIFNKVLAVIVSDDVEAALFTCFGRCTYTPVGGVMNRVSRELLDDPKLSEGAREDYYTMCMKVAEVNCKPFFKKTFSGLSIQSKIAAGSPVQS